jgi:hypothetical protein
MARTSTPWRLLPAREHGCGSSTTVRRRLDQWVATGVFGSSPSRWSLARSCASTSSNQPTEATYVFGGKQARRA